MRQAVEGLARGATVGWPLPPDPSCAGRARALLGDLLEAAGVRPGAVHDAQTMISELATNALVHAPCPPDERRGPYELWAYRTGRRLVCGVFDPVPEIPVPDRPPGAADPLAEGGRGLAILDACADGRWGAHLSRGLFGAHAPGKLVWFECPGPATLPALTPVDAIGLARTVRRRLVGRGITRTIVSACPGLAVLSVRRDLDLWCRPGRLHVRDHATGDHLDRPAAELAQVTEHLIRRHEELRRPTPWVPLR